MTQLEEKSSCTISLWDVMNVSTLKAHTSDNNKVVVGFRENPSCFSGVDQINHNMTPQICLCFLPSLFYVAFSCCLIMFPCVF